MYVTHGQVEAMTLGRRIAVLASMSRERKSNLKQVGTPLELYDKPQNVFVARFIGTPNMNMVAAKVGVDAAVLQTSGSSVPVPQGRRASLRTRAGRSVRMGVRPDHVGEAGAHDWPATASMGGAVETLRHEVIVHYRYGEDMVIAKLDAQRIPRFGEQIDFVMNCDAIRLFDPETEQRLAG